MSARCIALTLLLCLTTPIPDLDIAPEVTVLTETSFKTVTGVSYDNDQTSLTSDTKEQEHNNGNWLVIFYNPGCGHCRAAMPTWNDLAKNVTPSTDQSLKGIKIGAVNCGTNYKVCKGMGVRGWPTILLLHRGGKNQYSGKRTVDSYLQFVRHTLDSNTYREAIPSTMAQSQGLETGGVILLALMATLIGLLSLIIFTRDQSESSHNLQDEQANPLGIAIPKKYQRI